uniref:Uncharacterized protein n=1 Tax=Glossina pallidipes TaxID=7398 RepID=A0A1B0AJ60_GLOPL
MNVSKIYVKLFGVTLKTAVKITRYYTILHDDDDDGVCTEETIKAQPMAISVTSMNTNLQISKCFVVQLPHDKKNFSNAGIVNKGFSVRLARTTTYKINERPDRKQEPLRGARKANR